jgi:hypothetical protein
LGLSSIRTKDIAQGAVFVVVFPKTSWATSQLVSQVGPRKEFHGRKQDVATAKLLIGAGHIDSGKENFISCF